MILIGTPYYVMTLTFLIIISNFYTVIQNAINIFASKSSKIKSNYP
jgi:hypothetical protein